MDLINDITKTKKQIQLEDDVYTIHEQLGKGTFALVFKGTSSKSSEKSYAIKVVLSGVKTVDAETKALQRAKSHPNIIQFYMTCMIPGNNGVNILSENKEFPVLLFEEAINGDLFHVVRNTKDGLPEIVARTYFHQLFHALKHLHACGIYHRDIKLENLLLDHNYNLKLADFGLAYLSKEVDEPFAFSLFPFSMLEEEKKEDLSTGDVGTACYAAPEIFKDQYYLGSAVDIWSSGCALFVMLLCRPPFIKAKHHECEIFDVIMNGDYSKFWLIHDDNSILSPGVKGLLEKILQPDPCKRITVPKVFDDQWMKSKTLSMSELKHTMNNIVHHSKRKRGRA